MATEMQSNKAGAAAPATDVLNVNERLDSFKQIEDGWADGMQPASQWGNGYGKAPSHKGLDWLKQQFAVHYPDDLPRPYLYPTPEGGVQVEWSVGPHEASLEIDLDSRSAEWYCLNLETDESQERNSDLNLPSEWRWLTDELLRLETASK